MKKLISLCLVFVVLASCFTVTFAEEKPTLMFDLDLSAASEDADGNLTGIKDAVANSGNTIDFITYKDGTDKPLLVKDTVEGKEIKSLRFAYFDANKQEYVNKGSRVHVAMGDKSVAMKDELTFEMWSCVDLKSIDTYKYWKMFGLGYSDETSESQNITSMKPTVQWQGNAKDSVVLYPDLQGPIGNNGISVGGLVDKQWTHYVVTRKWINDEGANTGKWVSTYYVNGVVQAEEATGEKFTGVTRYQYDENYCDLMIGSGCDSSDRAIPADIATFKVYDGIVDAQTVASTYAKERANYMYVPELESTNASELSRSNLDFEIKFKSRPSGVTNDVDVATIKAENVYIKSTDCTSLIAVDIKEPYNPDTRTVKFTILDYLDYDKEYILCLDGIKDKKGGAISGTENIKFITGKMPGVDVDMPTISGISGSGVANNVSVSLNVTVEEAKQVALHMVVYKKVGETYRIVEMISDGYSFEGVGTKNLNVSTASISEGGALENGKEYKIKTFAVETNIQKGEVSLSEAIEKEFTKQ